MNQLAEVIEFNPNNITVFDEFESQLVKLEEDNEKTHFLYDTPEGNKAARSHVNKCRSSKAAIERARKEKKQASLDFGKALDRKAKELIGRVEIIIEVHAAPLRAIKEAEEARVQCHEDNIQAFFAFRHFEADSIADEYKIELVQIEKIALNDSWEEFIDKAAIAKDQAIGFLKELITAHEKLEADQIKLARLEAEKVARDKSDHEAAIAAEAERKAKEEAEAKAERVKQDNIRAEREKEEARVAAGKAKELELETAKREKAEAEERAIKAEQVAKENLTREQEEKAEAERKATEARETNKAHIKKLNNEIMRCLVGVGLSDELAKKVVIALTLNEIQHVRIIY